MEDFNMAKTKKVKEIAPVYTDEQKKNVLDKVNKDIDKLKEEKKKKLEEYERQRMMYAAARDYVDIASQREEAQNYLRTYQDLEATDKQQILCSDGVIRSSRHFLFMYQSCFWNANQLQMRFHRTMLENGINQEDLEKFMNSYSNKK